MRVALQSERISTNVFTIYRMELPHSYYRGKKHVPIPSGKIQKISCQLFKTKQKYTKKKVLCSLKGDLLSAART